MPVRTFKRHDTKGTHWVRFLDNDDAPIDLTGCTVVFTLKNVQTGLNKTERATVTIRDQTTYPGEAFYAPLPVDRDTELYGEEEFEVTYADGLKESFPVRDDETINVHIKEDFDGL